MDEVRRAEVLVSSTRSSSLRAHKRSEKRLQEINQRSIRTLATYFSLVGHAIGLHHICFLLKVPSHIRQRVGKTRTCRGQVDCGINFVFHPDLVALDVVKNGIQEFLRKTLSIVDTTVVLDKVGFSHAIFDLRTVSISIKEDDRIRENIGSICSMVGE